MSWRLLTNKEKRVAYMTRRFVTREYAFFVFGYYESSKRNRDPFPFSSTLWQYWDVIPAKPAKLLPAEDARLCFL
jgi:hypothetical protein